MKRVIEILSPDARIRARRNGIDVIDLNTGEIHHLEFNEILELRIREGAVIDTYAISELVKRKIPITIHSETGIIAYIIAPKMESRSQIRLKPLQT